MEQRGVPLTGEVVAGQHGEQRLLWLLGLQIGQVLAVGASDDRRQIVDAPHRASSCGSQRDADRHLGDIVRLPGDEHVLDRAEHPALHQLVHAHRLAHPGDAPEDQVDGGDEGLPLGDVDSLGEAAREVEAGLAEL